MVGRFGSGDVGNEEWKRRIDGIEILGIHIGKELS